MTNLYAQALWTASQQEGADAKKLVKNLTEHLKEQGRLKLLPSILADLKRLDARNTKLAASVEVAHEREAPTALKEAVARGIHAEKAHVNVSLIKGWRASGQGMLIDASAKRELIELYRSITTA
ncbi:F0F1 ATP synthase subunit delta [Patescibacteria group bacterium]|nr:F0F1 ATP synthase subunit delta [Patescibacteria group bacterium]